MRVGEREGNDVGVHAPVRVESTIHHSSHLSTLDSPGSSSLTNYNLNPQSPKPTCLRDIDSSSHRAAAQSVLVGRMPLLMADGLYGHLQAAGPRVRRADAS